MKLSEINKLHREYVNTVWKHNKTGNEYIIKNIAYNATNEHDGQIVAVYVSTYGTVATFVRNFDEFMKKFTKVEYGRY